MCMLNLSKRQKKAYAEKILRIKGFDYDQWLEEQHEELIKENLDLLFKSLDFMADHINKNPVDNGAAISDDSTNQSSENSANSHDVNESYQRQGGMK